jgi:IMP dehydrogenase
MLKVKKGYTFDDVLLIPKYSEVKNRADIDLSVDLGKGIKLDIPIISANMKNCTGPRMAGAIAKLGGLGLLHRFQTFTHDKLADFMIAKDSVPKELISRIGVSIGISAEDKMLCERFVDLGARVICVDIAYAYNKYCGEMVEWIAKKFPDVLLIAGNVATVNGAKFLAEKGADIVKNNVGNGSTCSTRIMTGNGVPSLTCMSEIYEFAKNGIQSHPSNFKIIADGGMKNSGDVAKNLCFSHAVMLGNILAGTDEAPGDIRTIDGKKYKDYHGSSTLKNKNVEGVQGLVPLKGPVKNVIENLLDGIRSACSYQGCFNLEELRKNPEFVEISNAGLVESRPHSVIVK